MENDNFFEKLTSVFGQAASVKNVFGEPVVAGNKTILSVATFSFGFGGGFGRGKKWKQKPDQLQPDVSRDENPEGSGGGGGLRATACGVYEITAGQTRFIPANPYRHVLLGVIAGVLLSTVFSARKR